MIEQHIADQVAGVIAARGETIAVTRTTTAPDSESPWLPGEIVETVYTVDGYVSGVDAKYIDGTVVLASDLMVVASPQALLNGAAVLFAPQMSDVLTIGGRPHAIKRISPAPAIGPAALFRIFVAS